MRDEVSWTNVMNVAIKLIQTCVISRVYAHTIQRKCNLRLIHKLTFLKAFSKTSDLMPSNLVSYSLAPPRTDRTNDGGFTNAEWPDDHEAVAVLMDASARARQGVLIVP